MPSSVMVVVVVVEGGGGDLLVVLSSCCSCCSSCSKEKVDACRLAEYNKTSQMEMRLYWAARVSNEEVEVVPMVVDAMFELSSRGKSSL